MRGPSRWRSPTTKGEIRVLHAGDNPDDFRSGRWIPIHCFSPVASAYVSAAATGCNNMIPRPYGVVQRTGPGALYKYWVQERGLHFGRDQIDNFSGILAEIRSTNFPIFWQRSVRDFLELRVGDRALQAAGRALCAYAFLHFLSFVTPILRLYPLRPDTSPSLQKRTCELLCERNRILNLRPTLEMLLIECIADEPN